MDDIILKLENITKIYQNGTVANKNINIELKKGEIHSIVGENGAGKSTLMKIIFAIEKQTDGKIYYKGQEANFANSMDAIANGIGMVHQHFMLIPSFTVAENIILGAEPTKGAFLDNAEAVRVTQELAQKYNFDIDVTQKVADLTVSAKQKVEIMKTLYRNAEVIILDEPTAVLTPQETEQLFEQLKAFKEMGHTIVFISHKLNEVKQISDRITVIRLGETKGTYNAEDVTIDKLTELIIGRALEGSYAGLRKPVENAEVILDVQNLKHVDTTGVTKVNDVSFSIKGGEILGIAGVQGNGQEELIRTITGLMNHQEGVVTLAGTQIQKMPIAKKRETGMSYIPEDRNIDGCAREATLSDNLISTYYHKPEFSGKVFLKGNTIKETAIGLIKRFAVKANSEKEKASQLSGGNVQKVVVAREWNTHPKLMIAEQPTRGIDVGSANSIHHELIDMRNNGAAILLASADLNEVMLLSDRLVVMYEGEIVAYFPTLENLTESQLGLYMLGVEKQTPEEIRRACYGQA
ncbi:MAG: ABC transporter ATP-binding protein [Erysipelotrichaceae bacterium]|nr:ABC transporter ATP-binding protein [Erysipelotrichaceae bacterium]